MPVEAHCSERCAAGGGGEVSDRPLAGATDPGQKSGSSTGWMPATFLLAAGPRPPAQPENAAGARLRPARDG